MPTSIEICAGAGGQALGLEMAGFAHLALVERDRGCCEVLRRNRPQWNVVCGDVREFSGLPYRGVTDLLAGGVPCPPFSIGGKQLGSADERDLFPEALRLLEEIRPRAVMLENVKGLLQPRFDSYRESILGRIRALGYNVWIKLLNSSDYGAPQLRPRVVIVGIRSDAGSGFEYPPPRPDPGLTVGAVLEDLMGRNGWEGAAAWARKARGVAPTIVGGSRKHGGPDLGPVRARRAWAALGVDGRGVAAEAPGKGFEGAPRLTPRMLARLQGFPDSWTFAEGRTAACRMIGNAFPPPVARAVGEAIRRTLGRGALQSL